MVDGCSTDGVGTKPKPLLSSEVSSLVRVQEDRFSYTVVIVVYPTCFFLMLIVVII